MTERFTRGPWRIDTEQGRSIAGIGIYANEGPLTVCPAIAHGVADALLIAAAPELYAALDAILKYGELACVDAGSFYPPGGKKPSTKDVWQFPRHMLTALETALAKARGDVA